uniref:Protein kinase domain-containing protein n=1 Tax=Amphimedon queenslandica TaxID=400682 RepID=A0A1X7UBE9_AMPQE
MDKGQLQPLLLPDIKETGKELGRGAYGVVTEVIVSGTTCAAKKLHDAIVQGYTLKKFCDEVLLHSQQRHPNIVQLIGVYYPPRSQLPMLVMEYLPLSLTQCLEREELPLQMKYSILLDVAKGLCYLHGKRPPIVHRDLTANNVLLTSSYSAKISDLGVSRLADTFKKHHLTTAPGNAIVMPPEALEDNPVYDHKLDVFSYGCLILHVLTGQFPEPTNQFVRIPGKEHFRKVSEWDRRSSYIKNIPKETELLPLAKQCLNDASTGRPEMIESCQFIGQVVSKYYDPKIKSTLELIKENEAAKKREWDLQ